MKRSLLLFIIFSMITCLFSCKVKEDEPIKKNEKQQSDVKTSVQASQKDLSFEEACGLATDVVIATYQKNQPFGEHFTEYSFTVEDRILGNSENNIGIFIQRDVDNNQQGISLQPEKQYLLILYNDVSVYSPVIHYEFIANVLVDLENPINSTMYHEPLSNRTKGIQINENTTAEQITEYVRNLTRENLPAQDYCHSDKMEDVVMFSTDIIKIRVGEYRGSPEIKDFRNTDFYLVTVQKTLKGNLKEGDVIQIIFFNDTVQSGEEYFVMLDYHDGSAYYRFSSKKSLLTIDQEEALIACIK